MIEPNEKVKVGFLGSRPISLKGLEVVLDYMRLHPDRIDVSFFAKNDVKPPPGVVHWWNLGSFDHQIDSLGLKRIKDEQELIKGGFDLVNMVFHNDIIPGEIINVVPRGITNLHFGYLPTKGYSADSGSPHKPSEPYSKGTYRGSNVLTHAILQQEEWHAVTFHFISAAIDLGPVIEYAWNPITEDTTPWDLQQASEIKAIDMFKKYFPLLVEAPEKVETIPAAEGKFPYYNRQSLEQHKILNPKFSDKQLALLARSMAFPHTEPPYFIETDAQGRDLKRYVIFTKNKGVQILPAQEEIYLQKEEDLLPSSH